LQRLIGKVRATLRSMGLDRSSRIAIAIPTGPQAALAIVAVACSAVSIPLNPRQSLREAEFCLAALRPDAVLLVKGADSAARRAAEEKNITIIEVIQSKQSALDFSIVKPQAMITAMHAESDEPDPDAPAFIFQSSGTTAEPKLIPFSHRNMLAAATRLQAWFDLTPQDRCLSASPLFYSHGLKVTVFTPLLTGGTVAFPADASKFDYLEWFGSLKPTWYSSAPTLHRLIFDQIQSKADAKTGHLLRFVLSGGAPLPRNVLEGLQQTLGVPVVEHYGSSEAAQIAANLPRPKCSKLGTCGIPWPGTVMIVGEDGQPLPPGEQGEILVGGPTVTSGYLNAPELNRMSFVNGWFKSGDIGSIDSEGFLTLHGRKNDLINRGGEKISPIEIDEALLRHPAVAEAAAFPVPHPRLGEDVAAAVVLRAGMTTSSVELRKYLHGQLASFKVPRKIVFRDQLPKGQSGKFSRRLLIGSLEEKSTAGTETAAQQQITAPQLIDDASVDSALTNQLTEIWKRLLKVENVSLDDDFIEKGGDSLLAVEMLAELEWLTGKTIPDSLLFEARTIRQLARDLSKLGDLQPKPVNEVNSSGTKTPLIVFHGGYNSAGYWSVKLANLLGPDQPVLIVHPHGLDGGHIPSSIEAMAADRLREILDAQPEGPYRLCGSCVGGIVAFEVARQLIAAGKKVDMVVMLDSPTFNAQRSVQLLLRILSIINRVRPFTGITAWVWFKFQGYQVIINFPRSELWARVKRKVRKLFIGGKSQTEIYATPVVPTQLDKTRADGRRTGISAFSQFSDDRTIKYCDAMSRYFPTPLAVRVIYFVVELDVGAWRRISADLEVIKLPFSNDQGIMNFPPILVGPLRECLQASK
jgi:acyl-CoA synthetase (AMP-forming)/AMP-acid ligase II/acyl carrier protein